MQTDHLNISLLGSNPPQAVPAANVFFTFESGRLDYDCKSCGAQCCRGHGFSLTGPRELDSQLALQPLIRMFIASRERLHDPQTKTVILRNCPPACFFLDEDGLCNVQKEHGQESKPETCRLFPFNSFRFCDGYLIVAPHTKLCPLAVTEQGTVSSRSDHARLFADMALRGISGSVTNLVRPVQGTAPELLGIERRIMAVSRPDSFTDYKEFARQQLSLSCDGMPQACGDRAMALESFECGVAYLDDLFGIPPGCATPDAWMSVLTAVTPTLRSHLVFRPTNEEKLSLPLARVPSLLTALAALVGCAHLAGMNRITYQTVMYLFTEFQPVLQLCAWLDAVMVLRPDAAVELGKEKHSADERRVIDLYRALTYKQQRKRQATLGALLIEHVGDSGVDRMAILDLLARRLIGHIAPMAVPSRLGWPLNLTPRLQQWALGGLGTEMLLAMGRTQRSRRDSKRRQRSVRTMSG